MCRHHPDNLDSRFHLDISDPSLTFTLADGTVLSSIEAVSFSGGLGNDIVTGGTLGDTIAGGGGRDLLSGGSGADSLSGGAGNDLLVGGAGVDIMSGGTGDDTYVYGKGDIIYEEAGEGTDTILVSASLSLAAFENVENLSVTNISSTAAINLAGNELDNVLTGGAGANVLNGAEGNDTLIGEAGNDAFLFNTALNATGNVDTILDFHSPGDVIRLENAIFRDLKSGTLSSSAFLIGTKAKDKYDRIVYDKVTGDLYYDRDGTGKAAAVLFAKLGAGTTLTYKDFFVI